jgi:hypothetical protein
MQTECNLRCEHLCGSFIPADVSPSQANLALHSTHSKGTKTIASAAARHFIKHGIEGTYECASSQTNVAIFLLKNAFELDVFEDDSVHVTPRCIASST